MASRTPWLRSVTITTANVNENLLTLLQAADSDIPPHCQMFQIQLDIGAGAARLYIGDTSSLTATDVGVELVAGQAFSIGSVESNLINLADIAVRSDTNSTRINVTIVVR